TAARWGGWGGGTWNGGATGKGKSRESGGRAPPIAVSFCGRCGSAHKRMYALSQRPQTTIAARGGPVSGFPFSAVVGMEELRLGLVLNAVSPGIGGGLGRGEKGTPQSTMARALAAILPGVEGVAGGRVSCDPAAPDPAWPDGPPRPRAA